MIKQLKSAIIDLLHPTHDEVIGSGFLVNDEGSIVCLTSSLHSYSENNFLDIGTEIRIRFAHEPEQLFHAALFDYWEAQQGNVSILSFSAILPEGVSPLPLGKSEFRINNDLVKVFHRNGEEDFLEDYQITSFQKDVFFDQAVITLNPIAQTRGYIRSGVPAVNTTTGNIIGLALVNEEEVKVFPSELISEKLMDMRALQPAFSENTDIILNRFQPSTTGQTESNNADEKLYQQLLNDTVLFLSQHITRKQLLDKLTTVPEFKTYFPSLDDLTDYCSRCIEILQHQHIPLILELLDYTAGEKPEDNTAFSSTREELTYHWKEVEKNKSPDEKSHQQLLVDTQFFFAHNISKQQLSKTAKEGLKLTNYSRYNRDPNAYWSNSLKELQHRRISTIIHLLQNCELDNDVLLGKQQQLINRWTEVEETPYRFIYARYLNEIISEAEYVRLDRIYIEILGTKQKTVKQKVKAGNLDTQAVRIDDDKPDKALDVYLSESSLSKQKNTGQQSDDKKYKPSVNSVLNIADQEEKFVIMGSPGSGKTISLKKIVYQHALRVRRGDHNCRIPILIIANQYIKDKVDFEQLLSRQFPDWNNPLLVRSRFTILIDGFNEISPAYQSAAKSDIKDLLNARNLTENENKSRFILSCRKYGFERLRQDLKLKSNSRKSQSEDGGKKKDLVFFELKDLNDSQLYAFIDAYLEKDNEKLKKAISTTENEHIRNLAYSPLTLFMIIATYDPSKGQILPDNRGQLFQRFILKILKRTTVLGVDQIDLETKEKALSELAFYMRKKDFNPSREVALNKLNAVINDQAAAEEFLEALNKTYILRIKKQQSIFEKKDNTQQQQQVEGVSFMHESYLEYFCAQKLHLDFVHHNTIRIPFDKTEWFETIIMAADLFGEDKKSLASYIAYLFNGGTTDKRIKNYHKNLDTSDTPYDQMAHFFYPRMEIATKVAFHVKHHSPSVYISFRDYFYYQLLIWESIASKHLEQSLYQPELEYEEQFFQQTKVKATSRPKYFLKDLEYIRKLHIKKDKSGEKHVSYKMNYSPNVAVLESIFAAVGGLSSSLVLHRIFTSSFWQLCWLLPHQIPRPSSNTRWKHKDTPLGDRLKNKLLQHLSDYELLFDYLHQIDKQAIDKDFLLYSAIQKVSGHLKRLMPLKLLKKLYEAQDIDEEQSEQQQTVPPKLSAVKKDLLNKIGQQDPLYYIQEFKKYDASTEEYVNYLLDFYYNKKVQKELFDILFAKDDNHNLKKRIIIALMKSFYNTEQVLHFLEQNFSTLTELEDLRLTITNYLNSLPLQILPPNLQLHYTPQSERHGLAVLLEKKSAVGNIVVASNNTDITLLLLEKESENNIQVIDLASNTDINPEVYKDWVVFNSTNLHPDTIRQSESLITLIRQYIPQYPPLGKLMKNIGLAYLFYDLIPDLQFGIIMRTLPSQKKVIYIKGNSKEVAEAHFPDQQKSQLQESSIAVLEKTNIINPLPTPIPLSNYSIVGYEQSFIVTIKQEEINKYAFIYNFENKDYFIHEDHFGIDLRQYQRVWFYPCLNLSRKYEYWPLARKLVLIEQGDYQLEKNAIADTAKRILKFKNTLQLTNLERDQYLKTLDSLFQALSKAKKYEEIIHIGETNEDIVNNYDFAKYLGKAYFNLNQNEKAKFYFRTSLSYNTKTADRLEEFVDVMLLDGDIINVIIGARTFLGRYFYWHDEDINIPLSDQGEFEQYMQEFKPEMQGKHATAQEVIKVLQLYGIACLEKSPNTGKNAPIQGVYYRLREFIHKLSDQNLRFLGQVATYLATFITKHSELQQEGIDLFKRLERVLPNDPFVYCYYAISLYQINPLDTRIDDYYQKAIELAEHQSDIIRLYHEEIGKIKQTKFQPGISEETIGSVLEVANYAISNALNQKSKTATIAAISGFKMLKGLYTLGQQRQDITSVITTLLKKYGLKEDDFKKYSAYDIVNNKITLNDELLYEYIVNISRLNKIDRLQEALNIIIFSQETKQADHIFHNAYKLVEARIQLRLYRYFLKREDNPAQTEKRYQKAKRLFRLAIQQAQTPIEEYTNQLDFARNIYNIKQVSDFDEADNLLLQIREKHGFIKGTMRAMAARSRNLKKANEKSS